MDGVNYRFETVVRAELLIHMMQVIANSLRGNVQLPRHLRRRSSL